MGGMLSAPLPDYNPDDYINDTELDLNPMNYPRMGNYDVGTYPLIELALWKPMKFQMKYSDAICRRYAKNPLFLSMHIPGILSNDIETTLLNETSIGNIACLAYHNPDNAQVQEAYQKSMRAFSRNLTNDPRVFGLRETRE